MLLEFLDSAYGQIPLMVLFVGGATYLLIKLIKGVDIDAE